MPDASLRIENARYIITMDDDRRIIRDGAVVIEGSRIVQVGRSAELADVAAERVIDADGMVVAPGLVNGHMHVSYAHATRGIFPDSLGSDYLPNVFRLQGEMTAEEEYLTSLLGITELLKYGTTTFIDPGSTKFLDAGLRAYEQSGCRIIVGAHVTDQPNPVNLPVYDTDEAVAIVGRTIRDYDGALDGRVRAWAMPFGPNFATPRLLQESKRLADDSGVSLTLHFNNSRAYVESCLRDHGMRPTQYLESLGVLGENVVMSHCLGLDQSEVDVLARTGTKVVAVPTAAVKSGFGMTSEGLLPEMLDAGITVGIGTDAGNNSNLIETNRAMYLIAVLYKDARRSTTAITAETALELATIGGARALGLGDEIGSIEPGKKADLALYDTRRAEWATLFNPVNSLVYNADGRSVHTVLVDGRVVVENHTPLFVDEQSLIAEVQAVGESMLARTGLSFPSPWPII
ncbi:MAG: amidohydrolase [Chloroflexi bacterium]|nr:amidohydrolase [Chloroflexota bacterium]MYE40334.1 amidohydrolase [Chloroflexota bacterium]